MKDYLLIIRTEGSVWSDLSPEQLQKHLEHGMAYIGNLMKEGKLKIGRSNKKVTDPKQAIAIGLSEAREEGAKVPYKKASKKKSTKKKAASKASTKRKAATKRSPARKAATKTKTVKK